MYMLKNVDCTVSGIFVYLFVCVKGRVCIY